jgi:hypothetical protein
VIDRSRSLGAYLNGAVADAFRESLSHIVETGGGEDSGDEFLGNFDALMRQPTVYH